MKPDNHISRSIVTVAPDNTPARFTQKPADAQLALIQYRENLGIETLKKEFSDRKELIVRHAHNAKIELQWFKLYARLSANLADVEAVKQEAEILSDISLEVAHATNTLGYWMEFMNEEELVLNISFIIKRFIAPLKSNKNLTDTEIYVICIKLIRTHKNSTRIGELILMMYYVLTRKFDVNDFKIDETDFWNWYSQMQDMIINHRETTVSKDKRNSVQISLDSPTEQRLNEYNKLQEGKKEIRDRVYGKPWSDTNTENEVNEFLKDGTA